MIYYVGRQDTWGPFVRKATSIFHQHPIHQGALPNAGMTDEKNLRKFLQEERGFSEKRMTRALNRLKSVGKLRNTGQSSLFDF